MFSGFPSNGFCSTLVRYHIQNGSFDQDIILDGIDAIYAASWPKAIHEANGAMQLFITKRANEKQRQALVNISSGQAKGEGPFALFAGTFSDRFYEKFRSRGCSTFDKELSIQKPIENEELIEKIKQLITKHSSSECQ
jgi:hypothetical protein